MAFENPYFIDPINPEGARVNLTPPTPGTDKFGNFSFQDLLEKYIKDVNQMQVNGEDSATKLATGEIKEVHQVMTAVAEAEITFKMMMEIRNKLVTAYQELIKTSV